MWQRSMMRRIRQASAWRYPHVAARGRTRTSSATSVTSHFSSGLSRARRGQLSRGARGFTLLELMLALALTAVLLTLVNMAVDLYLRQLTSHQKHLEESQLARSILRIVADDIRAVAQAYEQDVSGVQAMIQQAGSAAAGQLAGGSGGGVGGAASGGGGTTAASGGGQTSSGGGASSATSAMSTSSSTAGGQSSGSAATSGRGSATSGSGATTATMTSGSSADTTGESTMAGTDLTTMSVPEVPGVYGNQYQLQLDVSRLPRVEQYQQVLTEESATSITDIPSDLKTVTYFVQVPAALPGAVPVAGASTGALSDLTDPQANGIGLVRRELDRAVTSAAMASGNTAGIISGGDLLAPEVAGIEFRYFDGIEWRLEWDTSVEKKLPLAIQILLALTSPDRAAEVAGQLGSGLTAEGAPMRLYTMVVQLPTGGQPSADEETTVDSTGTSTAGATGTGMTGGGATP